MFFTDSSHLILPQIIIPQDSFLRHNLTTHKSQIHGLGLFAQKDFQPLEVIWTETPKKDKPENDGPLRWTNHSDNPNASLQNQTGSITLVAIKPIQAGEEITYSYTIFGQHTGHHATCHCRSIGCLGSFILRTEWDEHK